MDMESIKYHMQELKALLEENPNHMMFADLYVRIEGLLNGSIMESVEARKPGTVQFREEG